MKFYSSRYGTARGLSGVGGLMGDADQDDWDSRGGNVVIGYDAAGNPYDASAESVIIYGPAGAPVARGNPQASPGWWESLPGLLEKGITLKQVNDVNQINIERARRGQPPLTSAQMRALSPQVNVGVSSDTQRMMFMLVAIMAGAYILPKLFK